MEKAQEIRSYKTTFETRENQENNNPVIEGYFVRFDDVFEISPDMSESIDKHALDKTLGNDIRALADHDTGKVLGRTSNGTLQLKLDDLGLWGSVSINPKDTEAMNYYERVKRGDISQCSFGFNILDQKPTVREDGGTHWTIKEADVLEVSIVAFPAYEATSIVARSKEVEDMKERENTAWKLQMKQRLKGETENGIKSINDKEEPRSEEE